MKILQKYKYILKLLYFGGRMNWIVCVVAKLILLQRFLASALRSNWLLLLDLSLSIRSSCWRILAKILPEGIAIDTHNALNQDPLATLSRSPANSADLGKQADTPCHRKGAAGSIKSSHASRIVSYPLWVRSGLPHATTSVSGFRQHKRHATCCRHSNPIPSAISQSVITTNSSSTPSSTQSLPIPSVKLTTCFRLANNSGKERDHACELSSPTSKFISNTEIGQTISMVSTIAEGIISYLNLDSGLVQWVRCASKWLNTVNSHSNILTIAYVIHDHVNCFRALTGRSKRAVTIPWTSTTYLTGLKMWPETEVWCSKWMARWHLCRGFDSASRCFVGMKMYHRTSVPLWQHQGCNGPLVLCRSFWCFPAVENLPSICQGHIINQSFVCRTFNI